jgi:gamma-glutamyltranspeptidase / glutathione hydrolase
MPGLPERMPKIETTDGEARRSADGWVTSAHPEACRIGQSVLSSGGNAVDAAVATALALGVVDPMDNGLGGFGGIAVVHMSGQTSVLDYLTVAHRAARADMFEVGASGRASNQQNMIGPRAISVPATLAGLSMMLETYGTSSLDTLLAPIVDLANGGFKPTTAYWEALNSPHLGLYPETLRLFQKRAGGDMVALPEYAKTLAKIADHGPQILYRGSLGELICDHVRHANAFTMEDLATYRPRIVSPHLCSFEGFDLALPFHGSGGPAVSEILLLLKHMGLPGKAARTPEALQVILTAFQQAWRDRLTYMGDVDGLDETRWARIVRDASTAINQNQTFAPPPDGAAHGCTTHLTTMDAMGNAVSLTQSHGPLWFGSGVSIPTTGLVMNCGMAIFNPVPDTPNSIGPGKRPLTNAAPVVVLKEGNVRLAAGTPGGRRIISMMAAFLIDVLHFDMPLARAISFPRYHVEDTGPVYLEPDFPAATREWLTTTGSGIAELAIADFFGPANGIEQAGGVPVAALDPRFGFSR